MSSLEPTRPAVLHAIDPALERAYPSLSPTSRQAVQALAVNLEWMNRWKLQEVVASVMDGSNRRPGAGVDLSSALKELVSKRWLEKQGQEYRCAPHLARWLADEAVAEGALSTVASSLQRLEPSYLDTPYRVQMSTYLIALRDVRIAVLQRDEATLARLLARFSEQMPEDFVRRHPLVAIFDRPFNAAWLGTFPNTLVARTLEAVLHQRMLSLEPIAEPLAMARDFLQAHAAAVPTTLGPQLASIHLLRGELEAARQAAAGLPVYGKQVQAAEQLLRGDAAGALAGFEAGSSELRKATKRHFTADLFGVFHLLTLLRAGRDQLETAQRLLNVVRKQAPPLRPAFDALGVFKGWLEAPSVDTADQVAELQMLLPPQAGGTAIGREPFEPRLFELFHALVRTWIAPGYAQEQQDRLEKLYERAREGGWTWVAAEAAELLSRLEPSTPARAAEAAELRRSHGFGTLVDSFARKADWEIALEVVEQLAAGTTTPEVEPVRDRRLAWFITRTEYGPYVQPREQKWGKKGGWTAGRSVALSRLYHETETFDYLTAQDRAALQAIDRDSYTRRGYVNEEFNIVPGQALPALAGHPALFLEEHGTATPVDLVAAKPEIHVVRSGGRLRLNLEPPMPQGGSYLLMDDGPGRLKILSYDDLAQSLAKTFTAQGLSLPKSAEARVRQVLTTLTGRFPVHSDLALGTGEVEEAPADPTPHVLLAPYQQGLQVQIRVQPLGPGSGWLVPGEGRSRILVDVDGKKRQTSRDLALERARVAEVLGSLDVPADGETEWLVEDPEACLELLTELQTLGPRVELEWPRGETLKVRPRADLGALSLQLSSERDWFQVEGTLRVDDHLVLELSTLLQGLSRARGPFIPLDDGTWIALTRALQKRLLGLEALSVDRKKGRGIPRLAAPALEELSTGVGKLQTDRPWEELLTRIRAAESLEPKVPSSFLAELRPYQLEGFRWLSRLAYWGGGACLADDMGLGKTIQGLALLASRGDGGPALVVAPTSVCMNWELEAGRFAPALRVVRFGPGDRQKTLEGLGPFDLVVCSYGLMLNEIERLSAVHWHTLVLDEAQAIKNVAARRSQAVQSLEGDFRMATTGTPIENHLGELWNLFRFLNPGLLGSLEHFTNRYANPIERQGEARARSHLKQLVRPFLLRRTKQQVLEELPARTEITVAVELSPEETALYEALRREALRSLEALTGAEGQRRFQILAHIMKLRRACCHPRLALPDADLPGSKLAELNALVDELLEGGHKALIFSQFVDHLSIVREAMDARGVRYQYLDGSTPAAERARRVTAFQQGEGDLFLISLRAGGQGLNLTAADYVIHLDPWWNPAVEDQASDRAHRMGQLRPVTIYRLIARGTIEEQIVGLHRQKRELADELLEGAEQGVRLSSDELMRLLKGNGG